MKLKIRNIILILLHLIASALLFFPMYDHVMYKRQHAQTWTAQLTARFSFIDLAGAGYSIWSELLSIAICILFLVILIYLFLQLIGKNISQQNSPVALILTIINFVAFYLYSYFLKKSLFVNVDENREWVFDYSEIFGFELLVQIILVVIFLITYIHFKRSSLDKYNAEKV